MNRTKNYFLSFGSGLFGFIANFLITFFSIPISMRYWGNEAFGLWAIANSILVYLNMSSLGMDVAVSVLVAKTINPENKIKTLKKGFIILGTSLTVFLIIGLVLQLLKVEWVGIFGQIPRSLEGQALGALFFIALGYFINAPFSLLSFGGYRKQYLDNAFSLIQSAMAFAMLLGCIAMKGDLVAYAVFALAGKFFVNCIRLAVFVVVAKRSVREGISTEKEEKPISLREVFWSGLNYFLAGLVAAVYWNSDNFLISHYIGLRDVAAYAVTFKLFTMSFNVFTLCGSPFTSLLGHEIGMGNWAWIKKAYEIITRMNAVIGGAIWIAAILIFKGFIHIWSGPSGYAGFWVVFVLGAFSYVLGLVNAGSGILISMNLMKKIFIFTAIEAIIKIFIVVICIRWIDSLALALSFLGAALLWSLPMYQILVKRRTEKRLAFDVKFVVRQFFIALVPAVGISLAIVSLWPQAFIVHAISMIVIGSAYLAVCIALLGGEDREMIKNLLRKVLRKEKIATEKAAS